MKKKIKIIIAKEIIILLTCTLMIALLVAVMNALNFYYDSKIKKLSKEIEINNEKIENRNKEDFLIFIYEEIKGNLSVTYLLDYDTIDIPQKSESLFTKKYNEAKKVPTNKNGFEIYKDSYILNFIEFENFDSLFQVNNFYKNIIFEKFQNSFNINNLSELDSMLMIRNVLKNEVSKLVGENTYKTSQISDYSILKYSKGELFLIYKWSVIIVLLIIYPLRIIFIGARWSIKTLKENND